MIDLEIRVKDVARRLWEAEGRPAGRDVELWCMAERWVVRETACRANHALRVIAFPHGGASPPGIAGSQR